MSRFGGQHQIARGSQTASSGERPPAHRRNHRATMTAYSEEKIANGPRRGDAVDVAATNPTPLPAAAFDAAHTNQPA